MQPHKLLKPTQTRWLSLHSCVHRVTEQWQALLLYFEEAVDKENFLASQKILAICKLYFHFLNFVLPMFTNLNLMFQSSKSSLHCLSRGLSTMYRDLLSCHMREGSWRERDFKTVDPTSAVNFLPLTQIYMHMGSQISLLLTKPEYLQRSVDVQYFLQKVQPFFVEAACQIKTRFLIGDPMIELLEVLDPNVSFTLNFLRSFLLPLHSLI